MESQRKASERSAIRKAATGKELLLGLIIFFCIVGISAALNPWLAKVCHDPCCFSLNTLVLAHLLYNGLGPVGMIAIFLAAFVLLGLSFRHPGIGVGAVSAFLLATLIGHYVLIWGTSGCMSCDPNTGCRGEVDSLADDWRPR